MNINALLLPLIAPEPFKKAIRKLPPQTPEAAALIGILSRTWETVSSGPIKQLKAAFDFTGDGTVDKAAVKSALAALDKKNLKAAIAPQAKRFSKLLVANAAKHFKAKTTKIEKAAPDWEEIFLEILEERGADHIEQFFATFPERFLHPEIERMVELMEEAPGMRGVDLDDLMGRLERVTGATKNWEELGKTEAGRLWNATGLTMAQESGAKSFQVLSAEDKNVCGACWFLHGRVFEVDRTVEKVMGSYDENDPDSIVEALPFPRYQDLDGRSADDISEEDGMMPPFHPHCRCQLVPLYEGGEEEAAKTQLTKSEWYRKAPEIFDEAEHPRDEHGKFTSGGGRQADHLGRELPDRPASKMPRDNPEAAEQWRKDWMKYNEIAGYIRENSVAVKLFERYPPEKGFSIHKEVYLCDNLGRRLLDKQGEARRIDFVVEKDGKAYRCFEVTSKNNAEKGGKVQQEGKENYIRNKHRSEGKKLYGQKKDGDVIPVPYSVKTTIVKEKP